MFVNITDRFTLSYWDWTLVAANPWKTEFPSPWCDGPAGLGGNSPGMGMCVNTGPFRDSKWSLPETAYVKCLTRNFNGKTPDAVAVAGNGHLTLSRLVCCYFYTAVRIALGKAANLVSHSGYFNCLLKMCLAVPQSQLLIYFYCDFRDCKKKSQKKKNTVIGKNNDPKFSTPCTQQGTELPFFFL